MAKIRQRWRWCASYVYIYISNNGPKYWNKSITTNTLSNATTIRCKATKLKITYCSATFRAVHCLCVRVPVHAIRFDFSLVLPCSFRFSTTISSEHCVNWAWKMPFSPIWKLSVAVRFKTIPHTLFSIYISLLYEYTHTCGRSAVSSLHWFWCAAFCWVNKKGWKQREMTTEEKKIPATA